MERSKEKDCSQLLKKINILKAIYWIKQTWNDVKCDTVAKCFKKCGFVHNNAENLAENCLALLQKSYVKLMRIMK